MKKNIKILITIFCFLLNLNNIFADSFSDIKNSDRNYDAIEYVKEKGIVSGYTNGTFRAENQVNRAEYVKIIIGSRFDDYEINSCLTKEQKSQEHPFFKDINKGDWYIKYVCVAVKEGLIKGYPDLTFRAKNQVTLGEVSKILVSISQKNFKANTSGDQWFKDYVLEISNKKRAIPGTINNFSDSINRGEIAEIIYRLDNEILDKESPTFEDLNCENGDIYINSGAVIGDFCVNRGNIYINSLSKINGNISTIEGNIKIGSHSIINGDIKIVENGKIEFGDFVKINGSIIIENGDFRTNKSIDILGNIEVFQGNIVLSSNFDIGGDVNANRGSIRAEELSSVQGNIIALKDIDLGKYFNAKNIQSFSGNIQIGDYLSIQESIIANLGSINLGSQINARNIKSFGDIFLGNKATIKEDIISTWGKIDSGTELDVNKLYSKRGAYIGKNSNIWTLYGKMIKKSSRVKIDSEKQLKGYTGNLEMENIDKNVQNHSKIKK